MKHLHGIAQAEKLYVNGLIGGENRLVDRLGTRSRVGIGTGRTHHLRAIEVGGATEQEFFGILRLHLSERKEQDHQWDYAF